ncbi:hypothetical protein [Salinarchaeum sp. Harcht-Bsk1]|uniref:hypothetical protein n=1 Tax=Salinarchaeum sp. Harcht-Bsk1 TaxID=1333523 RepID=UPI002175237F|nr:hypothetical protein [Salinarchaeum sp. Harcht-Bsk1]
MDPPESAPRCLLLLGASLTLLTFGIGYDLVVGTTFADFAMVVTGLFIGWVAFFYCLGHLSGWDRFPGGRSEEAPGEGSTREGATEEEEPGSVAVRSEETRAEDSRDEAIRGQGTRDEAARGDEPPSEEARSEASRTEASRSEERQDAEPRSDATRDEEG